MIFSANGGPLSELELPVLYVCSEYVVNFFSVVLCGKTSRPTSESSSKELNLSCKLNQTWTNLTWTLPDLSMA